MKTGNSYKDGFLALAEEYRWLLSEEGEAFIQRAVNEKSVRDVLVTVYNILKDAGKLVELQDLSPDEKVELKGEARRLCTATDVATLMDVCKALHGFGSYIEIQNK